MGALHTGTPIKFERVKSKSIIQVILAQVAIGIKFKVKHPIIILKGEKQNTQ